MSEKELLKIQDHGEIKHFELIKYSLYVAVYFYPFSDQPFGCTHSNKNELIKQMNNWKDLDKTKPVRIYTINL